jgi:hypothetical protein
MNRKISPMKARLKDVGKAKQASSKGEDSDVQDNAGDHFGGRKKKKQKRANHQQQDWLIGNLFTLPNHTLNCISLLLYQCFEWCTATATRSNDVAPLKTTGRRHISGFRAGKRKISAQQGQGSTVVKSQLEMHLHAGTIVCGSNSVIMHYTGKECDVSPYTEAYGAIKSVPIVQAATSYN